MGKADLHIHTARGDGMADLPELLDHVQQNTDLTVIAITEKILARIEEYLRQDPGQWMVLEPVWEQECASG